ncbi:hypothetical protein T4D_11117 [Trichinella pseudospiralis]|uniref:Uncharacterized protein n=1 Tax=Trichinella pseudospiralis TaxID=6337 RepID=A0A0V1FVU4_TRIPS|nr:hypothetical protein T4D_11117 [Trichinella pseudospiralis]
MFILLRYYCDGKLGCSSGGKVLYCHSISENRYVVSYNSALQHHPKITDTSDTEEEKVRDGPFGNNYKNDENIYLHIPSQILVQALYYLATAEMQIINAQSADTAVGQ